MTCANVADKRVSIASSASFADAGVAFDYFLHGRAIMSVSMHQGWSILNKVNPLFDTEP
jgi:hypothetical protein